MGSVLATPLTMKHRWHVSVIIPTYNRAACIADAVASVLDQDFEDREVIVVDDGSTDDTQEVLKAFGSYIRILRQNNRGVGAARNAGVAAAKGKWIAFLDSDDIWLPGKLTRQVREAEAVNNVIAHVCDAVITDYPKGNKTLFELRKCKNVFSHRPFRDRPLCDVLRTQFFTPTWLIRKKVLDAEGGFSERVPIYEDLELLSRVALQGPFYVSTFVGVEVRRIPNAAVALSGLQQTHTVRAYQGLASMYRMLLKRPELNAYEYGEVRRRLSGVEFELAVELLIAGKLNRGYGKLWTSIVVMPGIKSIARASVGAMGLGRHWLRIASRIKQREQFRRSSNALPNE